MFTTKSILTTAMGIFSIFQLFSCKEESIAYESSYKETKVVLKSINAKGPVSNTITWHLQLGNLHPVMIDALTTDLRGRPYSDDIFGNATRYYLDDDTAQYHNEAMSRQPVTPTMLYFSKDKYDEESFEAYADLFRNKWREIESTVNKEYPYIKEHIIGIVHGAADDFVKEFEGMYGNKKMILRIDNDGRVRLMPREGNRDEVYSGLSAVVQMPGKKLYLDSNTQNNGLTSEELYTFRNTKGETIEVVFEIIPKQKN